MATVLMIDDVPLFRDVVVHALKRAGHQVSCAANGAAAMEDLKTLRPDLILLDLAMPEMNGLAFLRQLRSDKALSRTPVVVVSALSEAIEVKEAMKIGVQGHLLKSRFSLEQLIAMVQRVVPASRGAAPAPAAPAPAPDRTAPTLMGEAAAIARARADSARLPYTEADVHFMTMMIGHHAQAIAMSRMAPSHGASPTVQTLAERIINAQRDEIRTMQQWLRDRQKPVPEPDANGKVAMPAGRDMGHEMGHDMSHGMAGHDMAAMMPGMLTPEQMRQLDQARGPEFDRLFLAFMIQHHKGAVSMVQQLFSSYGAAQDETVFKFANDVNVDQTTEIARMERMRMDLMFERPAP